MSSRIQISVAADRLTAQISVSRGDPIAAGELASALARAGVREGIDANVSGAIEQLLADRDGEITRQVIARGTPPRDGVDGLLELTVQTGIKPGVLRDDGSMDFLERNSIASVEEGATVARYAAPRAGTPGMGVGGEVIAAKAGRDRLPRLGKGVELREDGSVVAVRAGALDHREGKLLDVSARFEHAADASVRSGHLETDGSLLITGSVLAGVRARAGATLEVRGAVDGLAFAGGDLVVGGGVFGQDAGIAAAEGSVAVRFVQGATVSSGDRLVVSRDALVAQLRGREIEVGGRAVGGELVAEDAIRLGGAGAEGGDATILRVAHPLERPVERALASLAQAKDIRSLARNPASGAREGARAKNGKAGRRTAELAADATLRKQEWRRRQKELQATAVIEVRGTAHAGVVIDFGDGVTTLTEAAHRRRFRFALDERRLIEEALPQ